MERLFDPIFFTKFTGRGMGLPVVLGIVRAHDGVLTVASEPGRGSVFRVLFPVSADVVPRTAIGLDIVEAQRNARMLTDAMIITLRILHYAAFVA
jgi:chemotaxis protein histidine kinase CheA